MKKANIIVILSVFFLFLCIISCISTPLPNDDIAIIRQRVLEISIWPAQKNIPATVRNALNYSSTLNSSCYWPDINYQDKGIVLWDTATHMYRITTMLQALTVNGSTIINDPKIMAQVHCALNIWFINDWQNPNWWFNQIDIPLQATSQLLMLSDNATSFEIEKIEEISYRAAWWLHRPQDTGTNMVWMIQSQIYRSLATQNVTGISQGFSQTWQDIVIRRVGEAGLQIDWSYHFHGSQIYSGGYGLVWAINILLFLQFAHDTQYQPNQQQLSNFGNFLAKGDAWMIASNRWDWNVLGRGVSRPFNMSVVNFVTDWIRSLARSIETNDTQSELLNFADRLDGRPNASLLIGNKHFYTSDYQTHRRVNWTSTIKMQSIRTQGSECINGQNQKDEHGGQGIINLFTINGNDYDFIFPLLDWQAINGITVEHSIPLEPCINGEFRNIRLPFVGGVSDGQYGLAMMDTASHNLTAKRSWHFYDDAIIALATNLTLTTSTTAWTTLASRLLPTGQITIGFFNSTIITLNDGNYSFPYAQNKTTNVQWIHVGGSDIGYLLQLQQQYDSLGIQFGTVTGNYNTIDIYNYSVTARMLTVWIDHGLGPYTLDYNYFILPNVSLESMPTLIKQCDEEQVFACISTNKLFHGTIWPSLKRASFVLWDNITTTFTCKSPLFEINVELNDAGAYLYSETGTNFTLTASHPLRVNSTVQVTIDRVGYGEGCTASSNIDATTTNVVLMLPSSPQMLGASVSVTCTK
jgi:chondroitin AC lyase